MGVGGSPIAKTAGIYTRQRCIHVGRCIHVVQTGQVLDIHPSLGWLSVVLARNQVRGQSFSEGRSLG